MIRNDSIKHGQLTLSEALRISFFLYIYIFFLYVYYNVSYIKRGRYFPYLVGLFREQIMGNANEFLVSNSVVSCLKTIYQVPKDIVLLSNGLQKMSTVHDSLELCYI